MNSRNYLVVAVAPVAVLLPVLVGVAAADDLEPSLALPPELGDALREVDVDAAVVDEDVVHLEVGVLARLLVLELDEGVLQRVARLVVTDHLAAHHLKQCKEMFLNASRRTAQKP